MTNEQTKELLKEFYNRMNTLTEPETPEDVLNEFVEKLIKKVPEYDSGLEIDIDKAG